MTRLTEALEDHGRSSVKLLKQRAAFFGLLAMLLVSATHVGMAAAQATFPVNSTGDGADSNTGDAICDDRTGKCTLRVPIRRANASAGTDNIFFSTPVATDPGCVTATGVCTIQPGSAQPTIGPVMIDGYTKPRASPNTNGPRLGSNGALKIELHGSSQSQGSGLVIASGNTTVRGLVVNRTASRGLGEIGDSLAINALSTLSIPRAWATFPGENGRIVFSRDFGVDLLTMNPDGSDQTRIAAGFVPTWSSDGTEIAFDKAENGNRDIYTMNADGTNESRITTDPLSDASPTWSPNGMRIALSLRRPITGSGKSRPVLFGSFRVTLAATTLRLPSTAA